MTTAILLLACVLLAGAVVALLVAVRRLGARLDVWERRDGLVTGASAPSSTTAAAVGDLDHPLSEDREEAGADEFVITGLGGARDVQPLPSIEPRLFADVVLREAVVKAASWAYAVRCGLSPANRNRIRFEMRREVKRGRKHRKVEERQAIREWRARRRAAVQDETAA